MSKFYGLIAACALALIPMTGLADSLDQKASANPESQGRYFPPQLPFKPPVSGTIQGMVATPEGGVIVAFGGKLVKYDDHLKKVHEAILGEENENR